MGRFELTKEQERVRRTGTHVFGHIPYLGKLTLERPSPDGCAGNSFALSVPNNKWVRLFTLSKDDERNQEGFGGPGEGMDISPSVHLALPVRWEAFTQRQSCDSNVHATWRHHVSYIPVIITFLQNSFPEK